MKIDRSLQSEVLNLLRDNYPEKTEVDKLPCYTEDVNFMANLFYLAEHRLIDIDGISDSWGAQKTIGLAQITADGIDFLEDDGGLGAILKKVTIKFDEEDFNKLILSRIEATNATPEKKSELKSVIKKLSSDGVKAIYMRLINYGLDKAPDALDLIRSYLS